MTISILDLARDDLINGYQFYENQSPGLDSYFLENIYSEIESLKYTGGAHYVIHQQFHRALSKRFPWAIYYNQHRHQDFTVKCNMVDILYGLSILD